MTSDRAVRQPAPFGEMLVRELLWIHGKLRSDLQVVEALAERVRDGAPASEVHADVTALETNSPLWKIRANCMYYCRFVHGHHAFEDAEWFPAVRRAAPQLDPVVDTLESDHRAIARHLDAVTAAVGALALADTMENRQGVVNALQMLGEHLLRHLAYEEEALAPTLRSWEGWPQ